MLLKINNNPALSSIHNLSESIFNFKFIILRIGATNSGNVNLDNGNDCEEKLITINDKFISDIWTYHKGYFGEYRIKFFYNENKIAFCDQRESNNLPYGISLLGLCRIN